MNHYLTRRVSHQLLHTVKQRCASVLLLMLCLSWSMVQAAPIQRDIKISESSSTPATFSDWTTEHDSEIPTIAGDWLTPLDVTNNSGQFSEDGQYTKTCVTSTDLDCSTTAAGVGRDLKKFSYTWDDTNLYMYVERFASDSSANDWWFYLDTNANGLMETGEIVLNVAWSGANGKTVRQLWTYNQVRSLGDPLTCPGDGGINSFPGYCPVIGKGDGYDMPGSLTSGATYPTVYGGATGSSGVDGDGNPLDGVVMETFISWAALGKTGPSSVGFHISSSNGTNIPNQLDDNMDGTGSGGSSIAFADTAITKTASSASVVGGSQYTYTLTVTNNGGSAATDIEVTDVLPTENVTYSADDDDANTTLTGTTLVWTIPGLASDLSTSLVVTMDSSTVTDNTLVSNTAAITDQNEADPDTTNNSDSADITLIAAPDLTVLKMVQTIFDPVNLTVNPKAIPGAQLNYTIITTNSGAGSVDTDTTVITDPLPLKTELFVGDIGGASSGPVLFSDGVTTSSGLSYVFISLDSAVDDVDFSVDNGATWTYYHDNDLSNIDADDFDSTVTDIRINPKGQFAAAASGNNPSVNLIFRVRLQ